MTKLEKTIDKLAREAGYPHIKLTAEQYSRVLAEAQHILYSCKTTTIERVKKGDYFRIPNASRVYVRDDYNRFTRTYDGYRFDDVNHFKQWKKGTTVEIDFDF